MNKVLFAILTLAVTFFTGFLGLIPMLIIGFNMYGEKKDKSAKVKKKIITSKYQVWALTLAVGIGIFRQETLIASMINGGLAAGMYIWADKRLKLNTEGQ